MLNGVTRYYKCLLTGNQTVVLSSALSDFIVVYQVVIALGSIADYTYMYFCFVCGVLAAAWKECYSQVRGSGPLTRYFNKLFQTVWSLYLLLPLLIEGLEMLM